MIFLEKFVGIGLQCVWKLELFYTAKDCEREGGGGNGRKSLTFSEEKKKDMEGNISDCLILIDGSSNNSWITQM